MKTVAVIPIKMNNERTPGKNTKLLGGKKPLIHLIQNTLLKVNEIDEIYVYCSKKEIKEYLLPGIKYLKRSSELDTPSTDIVTILKAFAKDVESDIYVLSHATAPFLSSQTIEKALSAVKSREYDSAFSVEKLQDFLWKDDKPMNYSLDHIPRTQDLPPLWEETSGVYVYTKTVINDLGRRIGDKPCMIEVSKIESIDIDTPEDFEIANALYTNMINH